MHKHTPPPYIWIMHTLVHIHSHLTNTPPTRTALIYAYIQTCFTLMHTHFSHTSHIYLTYEHMHLMHTHPSPSACSHVHTCPRLLPSSCFLCSVGLCPILFVLESLCVTCFLNLFPDVLVAFQDGDHVFNPPCLTRSWSHLSLPPHVPLIHSPLIASADLPRNVPEGTLVSPLSWHASPYDHKLASSTLVISSPWTLANLCGLSSPSGLLKLSFCR